ncbi:MAG: cobyrinate a,c-diamide synthase [Proteobacteria bacterium]|nr:cobyrinate a,c-diamide synthase [Pseudomonadota bacterium]MBU1595046.1 cobyrinate a,c-diamide synthase [Pseudomonadota bacterium]
MPKALVLAGTRSGCGKTSVALGLMRALARRGFRVQPFKAGPDFIDPGLHGVAAGRRSHNLDTWMMPEDALRACFARHAGDADVVICEGVMGLFDGRGGAGEEGSTAHLAKLLGLPVLLVVDAASQARSAAAVVQGFARFDPDLRLAGVVLNRVAGQRHAALLREALRLAPEAPLLGCLPRAEGLGLASRHLGLVTAEDAGAVDGEGGLEARLEALADWVEQGIDVPALLAALPKAPLAAPGPQAQAPLPKRPRRPVRIGLARDRAFCFVYAENLRLLEQAGAQLVPFSPLEDTVLPLDLGGLYLPGGYPELSARQLSANTAMLTAVQAFCASGRPVWAECGGFMYLQRSLMDAQGVEHPLCAVFPARARMRRRRAALGYREARTLAPGPFGPAGTILRGHEFHYSELEAGEAGQAAFALTASDGTQSLDGAAQGSVIGGYFHAHLASNGAVAENFVAACRAGRDASGGRGG